MKPTTIDISGQDEATKQLLQILADFYNKFPQNNQIILITEKV